MGDERTYLGLDLSTQTFKGVVVDGENLQILHNITITYEKDLPEFGTQNGAIVDQSDPQYITAPPIMWIKALDLLIDGLIKDGCDFSKIAALSGSAQQHGSVYWKKGAQETLKNLDASKLLHEQLESCFSVNKSPIWMNSSTTKQCKDLEDAVGGPRQLAEITGSRAYERFTGSQIAKIYQTNRKAYTKTERISLISSFVASLFLGQIGAIDISDGSGMNLMNIHTKRWHEPLLNACAPPGCKPCTTNLDEKLGNPVPSYTNLGPISQYYVERYNFNPDCRVIACTGDNPASLLGLRIRKDWMAVSLGTSDTCIMWLKEPKVVIDGHVLCNPIDADAYMALLCFKNGSLTRERLRKTYCDGSWNKFNAFLENSPRGNKGNMALVQKRLRREKRTRKRLEEKLDLEIQRRGQLEEALKNAGAADQIALVNEKLSQIELQNKQQQQQQPIHPQVQKPSPMPQNMSVPTSSSNSLVQQQQPVGLPLPPPPPPPTSVGENRLLERPERIKQEIQDDTPPQYTHIPVRDVREPPPPPPDTKPWGYSGMDIMNTGAAFWQNYSESLAQELEMERKSRQQQVEREVKSPLQDRSVYYKNSVLFTSSAT